jgi:uncharacterized protein
MKINHDSRRALRSRRFPIAMVVGALSMHGSVLAQNAPATTPSGPNAGSPLVQLAIKPAVPYVATPLPLADVRLMGGPLKHAQDLDAEYLLKLEPNRMLYFLRLRAGLMPKGNEHDGGWDGDGRQLTGHIAGHYLSAVSYMYAATGDNRFKDRVDYIVTELRDIQNRHGDGYIGALLGNMGRGGGGTPGGRGSQQLVDGKTLFQQLEKGTIRSSGFDLNGMWSPWYVEHKLFAGLRDAYRIAGSRTALEVEAKLARWVESVVGALSEQDTQRMLDAEFGGMNEVLADLYADTGEQRWLKLSDKFFQKSVIEPLAQQRDILGGKHGNTLVPKLLGNLKRYVYSGGEVDGNAAKFFFDAVVDHHSFATGGHGYDEYFGPPDKLSGHIDGTGQRSNDLRTAESCNVYNMLKMARELFALAPDIRYADYQERALFNHVLASIDPKDGRTCYMVPVGQGVQHEYQGMFDGFTCCVGSGMENHALHGYGIYYEAKDKLWMTLYAPTTAHWRTAGATISTETTFPEGDSATLKIDVAMPREFTLSLRRPAWAGNGFDLKVNGEAVTDLGKPGMFLDIRRTWASGDTVTISMPKSLRLEALPDNPNRGALMWGPLVLAGDLGPEQRGRGRPSKPSSLPAFVTDDPIEKWLKAADGDMPGTFQATTHEGKEITFVPFYKLHERQYGLYWDVFTPDEWTRKRAAYAADQERARKLAAATVSFAQPGEMQPERDYNFQGEETSVVRIGGQAGRRAAKWFSFDLPVDASPPLMLVVTYSSDEEKKRTFEIQADGRRVAEQSVEKSSPSRLYDVEYKLPAKIVEGKQKVTVKFQATDGNGIAAVCGIRVVRADAER